ncbi:uncharacterized protein [Anabrus simplex]|uniref:uncharacterized protein n=1 Tax=Anabrus simplex TaxID=316456 RepID=UPI0035A3AEA6
MFQCDLCAKEFSRRDNLQRHKRIQHNSKTIVCVNCTDTFNRHDNLERHINSKHVQSTSVQCETCKQFFHDTKELQSHIADVHQQEWLYNTSESSSKKESTQTESKSQQTNKRKYTSSELCEESCTPKKIKRFHDQGVEPIMTHCNVCDADVLISNIHGHLRSNMHRNNACSETDDKNIEEINSAFKCRIASYRLRSSERTQSIETFFKRVQPKVLCLLQNAQAKHKAFKVNFELFGSYVKSNSEGEITDIKSFNSENKIISESTTFSTVYQHLVSVIISKSEDFQERDSGWSLANVLYLEVNINKYNPLRGSSYIDLPTWIKKKKAVVNVQNNDQACFAWAVLSGLHPAKSSSARTSSYPHYSSRLNLDGLEFPMQLKDIRRFEKLNNISINVYGIEKGSIVGPLYFTNERKGTHINLLYIEDGEISHYCWIKNLSRLVCSQLSKHDGKKWLCDGCLQYFQNEDLLNRHSKQDCNQVCTFLPTPEKAILKFESYNKQMEVPFVIYTDFEAVLKPCSLKTSSSDPNISFTNTTHIHEPYSFAYYIKCRYDSSLNKFEQYRGKNAPEMFMKMLERDVVRLGHILNTEIPMKPLTEAELQQHESATNCSICGKEFLENDPKVFDHDHLTGLYRFPAHNSCNLKYKIPEFIPVILHNLSGYDSHFIIKEFGASDERIDLIPQNKERYISFTKFLKVNDKYTIKLKFIDSLRFMPSSLDQLSSNLHSEQFTEIRRFFPNDEEFNLIRRKGVFPYEFIDSVERLEERSLPSKESFYSSLNLTEITEEDYFHAHRIWEQFRIQTLGEYSDLYLKTDVLLLADVFENFRDVCIKTYNLDPCQYYTAPGLSWDAMLKYTQPSEDSKEEIFIEQHTVGQLVPYIKEETKSSPEVSYADHLPPDGGIRVQRHKEEYPFICDQCGKQFSSGRILSEHVMIHTEPALNVCGICQKCFTNRNSLTVHLRLHTGDKRFHCSVCQKKFTGSMDLTNHIRTHTAVKAYCCDICEKACIRKADLTKHLRTHTGEKPYWCNVCGRACGQIADLTKHLRTHTGEKPYCCNICGKAFNRKDNMSKHVRLHTGEKPYICNICGKTFAGKGNLNQHKRTHSGKMPYCCNICAKSFTFRASLTQHLRTHAGVKPYSCRICCRTFTHKNRLNEHLRSHAGVKPFSCSICRKAFSRNDNMTKHMRLHTGQKPYKCNICGKAFCVRGNLIQHQRTHTGEMLYCGNI